MIDAGAPKTKKKKVVLKAPKDRREREAWYLDLAEKAESATLQRLAEIAQKANPTERTSESFLLTKFFVHYFGVYTPLNIGRMNGRIVLGRRLELDCRSQCKLLVSAGVAYKKTDSERGHVQGRPGNEFFSYARANGAEIGASPSEERAFLLEQRRALLDKVLGDA